MQLLELLSGLKILNWYGEKNCDVEDIVINTNNKCKNNVYICLCGSKADGHIYASIAIANGAKAIICSKDIGARNVPVVVVQDTREAYAIMCANYFGNPAKKLKIVTVTGTNGKSTTAYITAKILQYAGKNTGLIGTMYYEYAQKKLPSTLTTPDPYELNKLFADMVSENIEYVVMELSAHAIYLKKMYGICSEVCMFTNLTQDHLDFFGDMQTYKEVKKSCFCPQYTRLAIVNIDDPCGHEIINECKIPVISYGLNNPSDVFALDITDTKKGSCFIVNALDEIMTIDCNFYGIFNVYNILSAIACAHSLGIDSQCIAQCLATLAPPQGRFNVIRSSEVTYIIDFAHTPDGLYNLMREGLKIRKQKLIVVFGCGGDRDISKRPIMGKIAGEMADIVIVTSDNPRTESRQSIADDILSGIRNKDKVYVELDRSRAISLAVRLAQKGDVVLIAGKGSENYIDENNKKTPYSDSDELNGALKNK